MEQTAGNKGQGAKSSQGAKVEQQGAGKEQQRGNGGAREKPGRSRVEVEEQGNSKTRGCHCAWVSCDD